MRVLARSVPRLRDADDLEEVRGLAPGGILLVVAVLEQRFREQKADREDLDVQRDRVAELRRALLASDDLAMWRPYLGSVSVGRNPGEGNVGWVKRGEELYEWGKKPEPPAKDACDG